MKLSKFNGNQEIKIPNYHQIDLLSNGDYFNRLPPALRKKRRKPLHPQFGYFHVYKDRKKYKNEKSWMDIFNIFECDTDYSDGYLSDL